ncbi:hypothetical protein Ocin01_08834 [Orchesella cincta]|uniref:Uncharacterized protein n=1 Tax=Orchesella cincta TaxID=48709 RepID=A0A1D2MXS6_ORCCI|nr:hypothetical protein Ocin01_08834 [Orchesella cincta]
MVLVLLRTVVYGNEVAVSGLHIFLSYFDAVMTKHSKRKSSHHRHHTEDDHHPRHSEEHKRRHSDESRPRRSGERRRHRKHSEDAGASRRQSFSTDSASIRGVPADASIRHGHSLDPQSAQSNRQSMAVNVSELQHSDQTTVYNPRRSIDYKPTSPNMPQISVNPKTQMQQETGTAHFQRSVEQNSPQHSYSVNPYPDRSYDSTYSSLQPPKYPSKRLTPPEYATSTSISEQLGGNTLGNMVLFDAPLEPSLEQQPSYPKPVSKIVLVAKCYFILDMILSISVIILLVNEILRDRPFSRALTATLCKVNKELKIDFIFKTQLAAKVFDVAGSILCILSILKRQRSLCLAYRFTTLFSIICSLISIANFQCSWIVEVVAGIILLVYYIVGLCLNIGIQNALRRARISESEATVNVDQSYNNEAQLMEYTPETTMNATPSVAYNASRVHTKDQYWNQDASQSQQTYEPEYYFI